jgi:hypothetical protein
MLALDVLLSVTGFALAFIGMLAGILLAVFLTSVAFTRVGRKGYRPPAAFLVVFSGWTVGIALVVAALVTRITTPDGFVSTLFVALIAELSISAVAAVFTEALTRILLRKPQRVFGPRNPGFSYTKAARITIIVGVVVSLTLGVLTWSPSDPLQIQLIPPGVSFLVFGMTAVAFLSYRKRDQPAPSLEDTLIQDPRPPRCTFGLSRRSGTRS